MMILASDYDGTLKIRNEISKEDKEAISLFRSCGHKFGIVTGRSIGMIRNELKALNFDYDFIVGGNGAVIANDKGEVIQQFNIEPEAAMQLIHHVLLDEANMIGVSNGIEFGNIQDGLIQEDKNHNELIHTEMLNGYDIVDSKQINSFYFKSNTKEKTKILYDECVRLFNDELNFHFNNGIIDATKRGVDKRSGIENLTHLIKGEIHVIGDGFNDLPMIEYYGGYTLHHADIAVKKKATQVFESVAWCIEYISNK